MFSGDYSLVIVKENLELEATIINVYALGNDVLIVFQVGADWILRGVVKAELAQIEPLAGKPVKMTFEMAEGRELVNVSKIEVIQTDDSVNNDS